MRVTPYKKGQTMEDKWGIDKTKTIKEKISKSVKEIMNTPEFKQKLVNIMHQPEIRYRHLHNRKHYIPNSEVKEKIRNSTNKNYLEHPEYKEKIKEMRAKQILPKKDTKIEVKIQDYLKILHIEFLTHQYMHIQHGYQCDIFIPTMNLVIECFGDYWHKIPYGNPLDSLRCQELREKGYKVLVFWENEIKAIELNDLKNKLEIYNEK
jgi:very-short-patch-repair endonuclease